MRRLRHFVRLDFLQSVDALAAGVEGVHEMHPVRPYQYDREHSGNSAYLAGGFGGASLF